jgi:hypothetical protein
MPREERPTVPAFGAAGVPPDAEGAIARAADDEPSSGVTMRPETLTSVPRLAVSMKQLKTMPLDHRAGFIASFVDGAFTIEMILDACAMPRHEALSLLGDLVARGVIVLL